MVPSRGHGDGRFTLPEAGGRLPSHAIAQGESARLRSGVGLRLWSCAIALIQHHLLNLRLLEAVMHRAERGSGMSGYFAWAHCCRNGRLSCAYILLSSDLRCCMPADPGRGGSGFRGCCVFRPRLHSRSWYMPAPPHCLCLFVFCVCGHDPGFGHLHRFG